MRVYPSFAIIFLCIAFSFFKMPAQSLNNSHIAFTIPEKDLLPESIAYDSIKNEFYIGSTRKGKIIKISKDGLQKDFVLPKQDGLWMIIGLKVDAKRRHLWVCSSGGDNLEGYTLKDDKEGRPAGVFKFNLDTGKLIKKYVLNTSKEVHFFNDLVISKQGDVYITHMFSEHSIYKISSTEDRLKKIISSDAIAYPNGITLSDDESKLYIAHSGGIATMNTSNNKIKQLQIPEGLKISKKESIDGLYFYNHALIGIQPDINTVQQFQLDNSGNKIIDSTPLEVNHPMMNNPTTGEIAEDMFYYISNAQFGSFNDDGSLFPPEKLYEVCILRLHLKNDNSKNEPPE
ncbi:SMP-30/gluconolactonase/LRE family protein [Aquimarina sp. MMG016]|uniref:SMP-30/gluconolactonase/LRE family protein n=1 Tax=Aquimarina sp. MMG016 TaxID=2822690 RepID=UPI001B3A5590|nr:SMP-30/gluconolactonase/LRE family protein [Aquimarina sp. MMG016]MBQ4822014.1 SMP-30/gluconolactonase/LRE family protein [Aquimarina sp. MMG016]